MSMGDDAYLRNKAEEEKTYRDAVFNTLITVCAAMLFGLATWVFKSSQSALEFFTGYIIEQSLSIDNLFVFIMLFNYFKVPIQFQNRVLTWGIIGAVVMRGVMIFLGVAALKHFQVITLIFAAILIVSAYKILKESFQEEEEEDLENNTILKLSHYFINSVDYYSGDKFFIEIKNEKLQMITVATPLFMCLICIELSDFVFAVDSIPAVLGISHDLFVVFTSNIFAIMCLRSLYILIAKAVSDLPFLKPAVGMVLGFVGGKMVGEYYSYEVSIGTSLFIVLFILGFGIICSYLSSIKMTFDGNSVTSRVCIRLQVHYKNAINAIYKWGSAVSNRNSNFVHDVGLNSDAKSDIELCAMEGGSRIGAGNVLSMNNSVPTSNSNTVPPGNTSVTTNGGSPLYTKVQQPILRYNRLHNPTSHTANASNGVPSANTPNANSNTNNNNVKNLSTPAIVPSNPFSFSPRVADKDI